MSHRLWPGALILIGCAEGAPCASCSGQLEESVTLEDVGFTTSSRLVRLSDGGFAAIGTYDPERIVRFDSAGGVVGAGGRRGNGPGEYGPLALIAVGRADTLYLADGARVHIVDRDLGWVRTVAVPATPADVAVSSAGAIVGHAASSSGRGRPTLYRVHPDSASRVSWFAPSGEGRFSAYRAIAAQGDLVWSVGRVTLRIEALDADGTLQSAYSVDHPWFDAQEPDGSARVADVVVRSDGRLLLLIARERDDWEPPQPRAQREGGETAPVALGPSEMVARWEQRILSLDPPGRILSTIEVPASVGLFGFADAEHVYGFTGGEELQLAVWRMRLDAAAE